MNEERLKLPIAIVNVVVPSFTLLIAVCGIITASRQYAEFNERAVELSQKQQQLQMKSNTYLELCTSAGAMLASTEQADSFILARKKFETCYYGTAILVDDSLVENSLIELKSLLDVINIKNPKIDHGTFLKLQGRTKNLSDACKVSLENKRINSSK